MKKTIITLLFTLVLCTAFSQNTSVDNTKDITSKKYKTTKTTIATNSNTKPSPTKVDKKVNPAITTYRSMIEMLGVLAIISTPN